MDSVFKIQYSLGKGLFKMFYERMMVAEEMSESLERDIERLRNMLGSRKKSGELIEFPKRDVGSAENAA